MFLTTIELRTLRAVEAGRAHSATRSQLSPELRTVADTLVERGLLRICLRNKHFPKRFAVTSAGSHALGTFSMASAGFHDEVWAASRRARAKVA